MNHDEVENRVDRQGSPGDLLAALRIIDANANRANEGLRVVEEYLRLALDDAHLTAVCKALRHDLTAALAEFPAEWRHAARDTPGDVGTHISTPQEHCRADAADVAAASFKRAEQSLRCLEEYGKTISPAVAARFEPLRYRLYTLEKALDATRVGLRRLAGAELYVLIDGRETLAQFTQLAGELVGAGVQVLQLRDKQLADRELLERARKLRELTRGTRTLFIMNDRPDLAALSGADGVHLGQEELPVKEARGIVGPEALIGVSTHSLAQARQAVHDGASYLGVGPTFPSPTKQFSAYPGLDLLRKVAAEIRLPAFAIGGIHLENLASVLAAGIGRVAVSSAIMDAPSPADATRAMLAALEVPR